MATRRGKPFRADDAGALQRLLYWGVLAIALSAYVAAGPPAMIFLVIGLFLLHGSPKGLRMQSPMEWIRGVRERELARGWHYVFDAKERRAVSLPPQRPPVFVAFFGLLAAALAPAYLGLGLPDSLAAIGVRLAIAVGAAAVAWLALFGWRRRSLVVLGADGVSVDATFVPYEEITGAAIQPEGVVLYRAAPAPPIMVPTRAGDALPEAIRRAQERARARLSTPATPAGFRENASEQGWRVQVRGAPPEAQRAVLERIPPERLEELRETTADAELEAAIAERLSRRP